MLIGGFQKFSLIDYPGKMAAIVFTQGCNFRCGYCYNPQLVCSAQFQEAVDESTVLEFLQLRQGKLQGVVVTGGEPTIQQGLLDFLAKVKAMHYAIKLDTNGSNPQVLANILEKGLVDFIAMDVKTSLPRYPKAIGVKMDTARIKASIDLIVKCGIRHQFRTTLVKSHCLKSDLEKIHEMIGESQQYVLKSFVPLPTIKDKHLLDKKQYSQDEVRGLRLQFQRGI